MQSLNPDFIFDKTYDVFLSIRYLYYFKFKNYTKEKYLGQLPVDGYDGIRDRGWLENPNNKSWLIKSIESFSLNKDNVNYDEYLTNQYKVLPDFVNPMIIGEIKIDYKDVKDYFYEDLNYLEKFYFLFGFNPRDTDSDGLPDTYENKNNLSIFSPDTDLDGIPDGVEVFIGSNPLDSNDYPYSLKEYTRSQADIKYINDNQIILYKPFRDVDLRINNPVLSLVAEIYVLVSVFLIPVLIFLIIRWWSIMMKTFDHYYHTFHHAYGWRDDYDNSFESYLKLKSLFLKKETNNNNNHHHNNKDLSNNSLLTGTIKDVSISKVSNEKKINYDPKIEDNISVDSKNYSDKTPEDQNTSNLDISLDVKVLTPQEEEMSKKWHIANQYMNESGEIFWRIAIIEADNILDELLKDRGYYGRDVGAKLKIASFSSIDLAWQAHKIRNKIAHGSTSESLSLREAKVAMESYRRVFEDFGII